MNEEIRQLEPQGLWNNFADLNAVPRPSKKEERVIAFIKNVGEQLGLKTYVDEIGNVIIKKPATAGMEQRPTVCLQSHLDMVHQKNATTTFDFNTQGIEMYVEDTWVKAKETTLGADNGIGVATIMTLLQSKDIPHPPLEALFTIDEETGLTGAMGLKGGLLDASIMLNLDTEEDNELTIGCAGGIDITGTGVYKTQTTNNNQSAIKITIKGLTGGHSGIDIHKGRANANKLMNRLLQELDKKYAVQIHSIDGGSLRNAIPRESNTVVVCATSELHAVEQCIQNMKLVYQQEYSVTDANTTVEIATVDLPTEVLDTTFQKILLKAIYTLPNGICRMDSNIAGLVQSSNNVSRILVEKGTYSIQNLTRSSVNTEKIDVANAITASLELLGATVTYGNDYPGWTPNPTSSIVKLMVDVYKQLHNNEEPLVNACHAGLECGILGTNYPSMEMISFGPTIHGAHSPDEKVNILSVQKFWNYLLATLQRI